MSQRIHRKYPFWETTRNFGSGLKRISRYTIIRNQLNQVMRKWTLDDVHRLRRLLQDYDSDTALTIFYTEMKVTEDEKPNIIKAAKGILRVKTQTREYHLPR